jgi:hypothetical protein
VIKPWRMPLVAENIPPDIGARLNEVRLESITEELRLEKDKPPPPPIRYGRNPPKLPA